MTSDASYLVRDDLKISCFENTTADFVQLAWTHDLDTSFGPFSEFNLTNFYFNRDQSVAALDIDKSVSMHEV